MITYTNIAGCTDMSACNYNENATEDDGSCIYEQDCEGVCGGEAQVDECGVCGGNGIQEGFCDCDGNVADCNGECGGTTVEDCAGVCGGDAELDECGVCNGNNMDMDCAGVCGGNSVEDECGVCGGDGSSCLEEEGNTVETINIPRKSKNVTKDCCIQNGNTWMNELVIVEYIAMTNNDDYTLAYDTIGEMKEKGLLFPEQADSIHSGACFTHEVTKKPVEKDYGYNCYYSEMDEQSHCYSMTQSDQAGFDADGKKYYLTSDFNGDETAAFTACMNNKDVDCAQGPTLCEEEWACNKGQSLPCIRPGEITIIPEMLDSTSPTKYPITVAVTPGGSFTINESSSNHKLPVTFCPGDYLVEVWDKDGCLYETDPEITVNSNANTDVHIYHDCGCIDDTACNYPSTIEPCKYPECYIIVSFPQTYLDTDDGFVTLPNTTKMPATIDISTVDTIIDAMVVTDYGTITFGPYCPGTYDVFVTDADGCYYTETVTLNSGPNCDKYVKAQTIPCNQATTYTGWICENGTCNQVTDSQPIDNIIKWATKKSCYAISFCGGICGPETTDVIKPYGGMGGFVGTIYYKACDSDAVATSSFTPCSVLNTNTGTAANPIWDSIEPIGSICIKSEGGRNIKLQVDWPNSDQEPCYYWLNPGQQHPTGTCGIQGMLAIYTDEQHTQLYKQKTATCQKSKVLAGFGHNPMSGYPYGFCMGGNTQTINLPKGLYYYKIPVGVLDIKSAPPGSHANFRIYLD